MLKRMSKKAKTIWAIVIAVVVIGAIGSAIGGGSDGKDAASAPTTMAGFVLPDYTGKSLKIAVDELTAAGIKYKATDTVNGKTVIDPANWDIESHGPAAGAAVAEGATVSFNVSKPGAAEAKASKDAAKVAADAKASEEAAKKALEPTETSTGLEALYAQSACETYAKDTFPFGVKMHWVVGKLAERIENDQWFLKVEATVTNAYGAKEKGVNVECFVGGTNDKPVVNEFNAY